MTAIPFLLLAILLFGSGSAVLFSQDQYARREDTRNEEALASARQTVVDMFSIDHVDPQMSLDRMVKDSTGSFKQQLVSQSDSFAKVVTDAKLTSKGTITGVGIRTINDMHAVVIASVIVTVHNAQSPNGYPRVYRLVLNLDHDGPASWLTSELDLVP